MKKELIAIAGFGEEGKALYEYFKPSAEIHIFDENVDRAGSKNQQKKYPKGAIIHSDLKIPAQFSVVYKSPGIPLNQLKLASKKTKISSLTNLFLEKAKGLIIGVTGTKGKSTTASLIYKILDDAGFDAHLIGNIGQTGLNLLKTDHDYRIYVYELSSFQLELLKRSPQIAVVTSLYADHLDHHKTFAAYAKAKSNISRYQTIKDFLVINADVQAKIFPSKGEVIKIKADKKQQIKSSLIGDHNQTNLLLSYVVAKIIGAADEQIFRSIKTYKPLSGRLELVATKRSIKFYDDALATIPEATIQAISALKDVDTLIFGGQDRGVNYTKFANYLSSSTIKNFIYFPGTGPKIAKLIKGKNKKLFAANSMKEAVQLAIKYTQKSCLLSAAAPSFGLFKDYKDRSKQYLHYIKAL